MRYSYIILTEGSKEVELASSGTYCLLPPLVLVFVLNSLILVSVTAVLVFISFILA